MRLIDADVFISYLKEAVKGKDTLNVLIMDAIIGMVEIMAEKEPKNQWIPCSKELPKKGTSVLFCDDEGDIYNGYCLVRDDGRYPKWKEYHNADRIKNVVAWMHWPDPWKGEEE